ncbi:hypothetical protein Mapa_003524 [Marchantia paleacea]|nr:hypothetical protein Mapa_003524 [Marchantia paleacea]
MARELVVSEPLNRRIGRHDSLHMVIQIRMWLRDWNVGQRLGPRQNLHHLFHDGSRFGVVEAAQQAQPKHLLCHFRIVAQIIEPEIDARQQHPFLAVLPYDVLERFGVHHRLPSRDDLQSDHSERVHIGPRRERLVDCDLGRKKSWRSRHRHGRGVLVSIQHPRQPEVTQFGIVVGVQQNVTGLDVSVNDLLLLVVTVVKIVQSLRDALEDVHPSVPREHEAVVGVEERLVQASVGHEFVDDQEHALVAAPAEQLHDALVADLAHRQHLGLELVRSRGLDHSLHRHVLRLASAWRLQPPFIVVPHGDGGLEARARSHARRGIASSPDEEDEEPRHKEEEEGARRDSCDDHHLVGAASGAVQQEAAGQDLGRVHGGEMLEAPLGDVVDSARVAGAVCCREARVDGGASEDFRQIDGGVQKRDIRFGEFHVIDPDFQALRQSIVVYPDEDLVAEELHAPIFRGPRSFGLDDFRVHAHVIVVYVPYSLVGLGEERVEFHRQRFHHLLGVVVHSETCPCYSTEPSVS